MDEAYQHWQSLCSILPFGKDPDCAFTYPAAAATQPPPPPPPAKTPNSTSPASCDTYVKDSLACAQKVTGFGFNDVRDKLDLEQTVALKACAQTMCDKWPGGGTVVQVSPPPAPALRGPPLLDSSCGRARSVASHCTGMPLPGPAALP